MSTHSDDAEYGLIGESTYELLSSSNIMTDSEDDGGSSVASLDEHTDDSVSLSGSDHSSDQEDHDPIPIPSFGGLDEHHLDESELTLRDEESSSEDIVFDEPEDAQGDQISVCYKLKDFTEDEKDRMWFNFKPTSEAPSNLFATVRQTMTKNDGLVMDGPLRVLYVGSTAAHDEICKKLGAALMAGGSPESCSSSWDSVKSPKYSVVPVSSFGPRSRSPEVELVNNTGPEIQLDVCTSATKNGGESEALSIWLNNTQNVVSTYGEHGIQLETSGWQLPHLAIVYISHEDDVQARMTRLYARSFITRHEIPTLVIAQTEQYLKMGETFALDTTSVHVCIESETTAEEEVPIVHKRFPIDLGSFLHLNALQLNRSLAVVTKLNTSVHDEIPPAPVGRSATRSAHKDEKPSGPRISKSLDAFGWMQPSKKEQMWKVFLMSWLCLCGIAGGSFAFTYLKYSKSPIPEPVLQPISPVTAITAISTKLYFKTQPSSIGPFSSKPAIATVSAYVPLEEQYNGSKLASLNSTDHFEIQILGKNHIIIRPPQQYLQLKRAPRLFVDVTREGQSIDAQLSKLFDGVYSLMVHDDDAWGKMNVSIQTKSKPYIKENLEVDFGNSWLQLTSWLKTLEQRKAELQTYIDSATADAKEMATEVSLTAVQQAREMQNVVVDIVKDITQEVTEEASRLYENSWKFVDKTRQEHVRTAQQNAKAIWEKKKASTSK